MSTVAIATAFRYEPSDLVLEWMEHVRWADYVFMWDTRGHAEPWIPRAERVDWMMTQAEKKNVDWLFVLDIDERLSLNAEPHLRAIAENWRHGGKFAYKFGLDEMFSPTERRIDGIWAKKTRRRFFRVASRRKDMTARCRFYPDVRIAHTQHIDPSNDQARVDKHNAFNTWDAAGRDGTGYDYLADRSGMKLETVPAGRYPELRGWKFDMSTEPNWQLLGGGEEE